MITFDHTVCNDFHRAVQHEWLLTNGIGGYASSTIIGCNTRRYHGLLVAATQPPGGRMVLLSKLEEALVVSEQRFELSSNQYPGVIHPRGYEYLIHFAFGHHATFEFETGGARIRKTVGMVEGENTVVLRYEILATSGKVGVELRPLLACRDYHHLQQENPFLLGELVQDAGRLRCTLYRDCPSLNFCSDICDFDTDGYWYRNFEYAAEIERGLNFREDLYSPGCWQCRVAAGDCLLVVASANEITATAEAIAAKVYVPDCDSSTGGKHMQASLHLELYAQEKGKAISPPGKRLLAALWQASGAFIARRASDHLYTILAGYHWFTDWGRDAMIALPGLTLVTGRFEVASSILRTFAHYCDQGMIPNRFPDIGEQPDYNTADATLWFFHAAYKFVQYTRDLAFVDKHLMEPMRQMIQWHLRGTRYNIHCDYSDGLLFAGTPGTQLTWMDAKVGEWVVTPRIGKPVEINALWYNAMRIFITFSHLLNESVLLEECKAIVRLMEDNFRTSYWNESEQCLYDVVSETGKDPSVRPNQIFAVSLPFELLGNQDARKVVQKVEEELLTPRGLRTLSPRDARYCGAYQGDAASRDGAYHQGTVWAWLIGPFCRALVKSQNASEASRMRVLEILEGFEEHLYEAGLGTISEVFDGDFPYTPRGCIAQAWSVAEVLRAYVEDGMGREPDDFLQSTL